MTYLYLDLLQENRPTFFSGDESNLPLLKPIRICPVHENDESIPKPDKIVQM